MLAHIAALAAGAALLLLRQAGHPAWQTAWAEDKTIFLPRALLDPWGSFLHYYGGYVQLVPQFIADVVTRFPLRDAAAGFAVAGAVTASGCALFVFHASAGHIRRPALRALLAATVLLLPTAVIEIANSGVDAQWYLLYALFWALLWRPASRGGAAASGLVSFLAMSSNILNLLYLPLLAARVLAVRRWREHAVTAGWLAGLLFQGAGMLVEVPAILRPGGQPRQLASPGATLGFYGQHVIVAAVAGWRLAARLAAVAGAGGAVVVASCLLLALGAGACAAGGGRVRVFLATALLTGFVFTVVPVTIRFWVTLPPAARLSQVWLPGSRFTTCAILLIDAAAVVAADAAAGRPRPARSRIGWSRTGWRRLGCPRAWLPAGWRRAGPVLVAALLAAGLGTGWVTSYRYPNMRSTAPTWQQVTGRFDRLCRHRPQPAMVQLYPDASPQARTPLPCSLADPRQPLFPPGRPLISLVGC